MWYQDKFIRGGIIVIILMGGLTLWGARFETLQYFQHKNRITGAVCHVTVECWFQEK